MSRSSSPVVSGKHAALRPAPIVRFQMFVPLIRGLIDRRILANYRVDPEVLAAKVPAPFRVKTIREIRHESDVAAVFRVMAALSWGLVVILIITALLSMRGRSENR